MSKHIAGPRGKVEERMSSCTPALKASATCDMDHIHLLSKGQSKSMTTLRDQESIPSAQEGRE